MDVQQQQGVGKGADAAGGTATTTTTTTTEAAGDGSSSTMKEPQTDARAVADTPSPAAAATATAGTAEPRAERGTRQRKVEAAAVVRARVVEILVDTLGADEGEEAAAISGKASIALCGLAFLQFLLTHSHTHCCSCCLQVCHG